MKKLFIMLLAMFFYTFTLSTGKIEFCADCWGNNCNYCTFPSIQDPDPSTDIHGGDNYPKTCHYAHTKLWKFAILPNFTTLCLFKLTRSSNNGPSYGSVQHMPQGTFYLTGHTLDLGGYGWETGPLSVVGHVWVKIIPTYKFGFFNLGTTVIDSQTIYHSFPQACL